MANDEFVRVPNKYGRVDQSFIPSPDTPQKRGALPTVTVVFGVEDWNARDEFAKALLAPPESAQTEGEDVAPVEHIFIVRQGNEMYAGYPHKKQAEVYASGFSKQCTIEMMLLVPLSAKHTVCPQCGAGKEGA